MTRAIVALGSNLGDRLSHLRSGLEGIRRLGRVTTVSPLYETDPVGGPRVQSRYLNAVAVLETDLGPEELLTGLHTIEGESERIREVHWGPRTLDLDLIAYGDARIDRPGLRVPHPRAQERRFVLAPLLDVAPDVVLADGRTPAEAITATMDQRIERWEGAWEHEPPGLGGEAVWWTAGQVALGVVWLVASALTADPAPSAATWLGVVLAAAGVALGAAALAAFGGRVSPLPNPQPGRDLVDRGVYRLVRHPMYGGIILTCSGVALAVRSWWGLVSALALSALLHAKSKREERALMIALPGYADFMVSVRRRFIPGLW